MASQEGLTESMLLRRMVAVVLAQASRATLPLSATGTRGGRGGYGGQIKLRLRPEEVRAIRALAEPEGYSAQAWIVRQLRHRLEDAVPFAREELNELREALRELGALGRNLNKVLHLLQRSDRFLDGHLELQALGASVEQLRRAVTDTVTRATHRGHRDGR
ncbi:MAG: plasmid mobilization protein [Rhodanobacteraceae bacterium]